MKAQLALYKAKGDYVDKAIRIWTHSPYSHCEIISSKDATMRIYEYDPGLGRLLPKMNQWLYPTGAAVQGDRAACLRSPDEVEFYYLLLPSSTAFVRCALLDS